MIYAITTTQYKKKLPSKYSFLKWKSPTEQPGAQGM
jgi:hypothetical protein